LIHGGVPGKHRPRSDIALDEAGQNDYEITPDATHFTGMEKRPRGHYATEARKRRKVKEG
jgi:hypothetical protein